MGRTKMEKEPHYIPMYFVSEPRDLVRMEPTQAMVERIIDSKDILHKKDASTQVLQGIATLFLSWETLPVDKEKAKIWLSTSDQRTGKTLFETLYARNSTWTSLRFRGNNISELMRGRSVNQIGARGQEMSEVEA